MESVGAPSGAPRPLCALAPCRGGPQEPQVIAPPDNHAPQGWQALPPANPTLHSKAVKTCRNNEIRAPYRHAAFL